MAAQVNPTAQAMVQNLSGHSMLLMKMQILSFGKNYDVMDEQKQVLCKVGLDAGQNVKGAVIGSAVSQLAGGYVGRWAERSLTYTYIVRDAQGNPALEIRKGSGGNKAEFVIADPQTNVVLGKIDMKRSLIGGLKASWVAPDGQVYMRSKGNIIRRKGPDPGFGWEVCRTSETQDPSDTGRLAARTQPTGQPSVLGVVRYGLGLRKEDVGAARQRSAAGRWGRVASPGRIHTLGRT